MEREISVASEQEPELVWTVWRQDFHGNEYRMPFNPENKVAAEKICQEYTDKHHHQTYFARQVSQDDETSFIPAKD